MKITGIKITHNGEEKVYPQGRGFEYDGYGDCVIKDEKGASIGTRKRGMWDEIEVVYEDK